MRIGFEGDAEQFHVRAVAHPRHDAHARGVGLRVDGDVVRQRRVCVRPAVGVLGLLARDVEVQIHEGVRDLLGEAHTNCGLDSSVC